METPLPDSSQSARSARSALIWGFILVIIGALALAGQVWPGLGRYIPLAVGLGLTAVFVVRRSYRTLVGAAVMTGLGAGIVVADVIPGTAVAGAAITLGLGTGFLSIWLISGVLDMEERHFWPLIPGSILALVGVGLAFDVFSNDWSSYVVPAFVVLLGLAFMAGGYVRLNQGRHGATA